MNVSLLSKGNIHFPVSEALPIRLVKDDICSIGKGKVDFKCILAAKEIARMKYLFVEDDNQGKDKPFEGIGKSIENLTTDILV